jgi:hypothetical protein
MTSFDIQGAAEGQQPEQESGALQQGTAGQSPSMGTVPGLPPTALSMQMASLNDQYQQRQQQAMMQQQGGALQQGTAGQQTTGTGEFARTSLQDMAERLAKGYGLEFGRGTLVNPEGDFMQTPEQLAGQGGDMATTAASMNQVARALNDRQLEQQQNQATAALQAGMGQVQQRGRGSLAAMQSGFYQAMAQNYTNPNLLPEQADFSFWIAKGALDEARLIEEKRLKAAGPQRIDFGGSNKQRGGSRPGPYAPMAFAGL